ncbi:DUF4936 family protein [Sulfuriferula nivalis]|uniref:DUF4936 family protein n=1 Tax=Sulfuriferula nivalis TaxID=2675298 RepID=A0A809SAD2_9PROT|nr:DUF4936 family protein [Sulfuriferula nivalis]BBP01522.1 hypothetical protein SFSGTM_22300 [Sulfuriferula nivalis]
MLNYYIYYRVLTDDPDTERQIRGMQARLGCRTGVHGSLLKRQDDTLTWMEVYPSINDQAAFDLALKQTLSEFDIEIFINGKRVTECFIGESAQPDHCRA